MSSIDSTAPCAPSQVLPGVMLGVGLGGFVDGILLHQVLQWQHMLSSARRDGASAPAFPTDTVAGLEVNVLWDGLFHGCAWLAVACGLWLLYRRVPRNPGALWLPRALWGWVLVGGGVFNLVEGLVDHHQLEIHHVRAGPHQLWRDVGFLALGAALVAAAYLLTRAAVLLTRAHSIAPR